MTKAATEVGAEIDQYRVERKLGQGGMATVLEVINTQTQEVRALKLIHSGVQDEEAQARFAAEFKVLSQLDHPHITRVYEQGMIRDQAYFVMERLEGQDLRAEVTSWKEIPPGDRFQRTESILVQVSSALAYIHDRGFIHRDISPSNIMVTPDGSAKLMDFGVVKAPGQTVTAVGEMVGTVAYMAPEQIQGAALDARVDLYSLGTVLYLMLTGKRPFNARTLAGYLEKHLHLPPRPPREVDPFVPAHLNEICMRLLEKSPQDRFGSATHLLATLDRRLLGIEQVDLRNWPPRLVGRTNESARILEAISNLQAGRGGSVLIEGANGFGKSRLLNEAAERAMERHLPVCRTTCVPGQDTYGAFSSIIESLHTGETELPEALQTVFRGKGGQVERYPVHAAVRDILRASAPQVLILDDFHFADRGSQELLSFLLRNHLELSEDPLLFFVSRQPTDEADLLADLVDNEDFPLVFVPLQPLTSIAVEELLSQIIPTDERTKKLANRLKGEGEGNPYFIAEMVRGLVEEGIIRQNESGEYALNLTLEEVTRTALPLPTNIRQALRERLEPLTPRARRVAGMLAIAQSEVSLELISEALGETEEDLMDLTEQLLEAGVMRQRHVGSEDYYMLSRPRLQDLLLEEMSSKDRAALHRRSGAAMERLYRHRIGVVVDSLAWHFEQGSIPAKSYPYLVRAGDRLHDRSFVPEAMEFYDRALAIEPEARDYLVLDEADAKLSELHLKRGLALFHMGDWSTAASELSRADKLARTLDDPGLQSRTACELGKLYRRQNRLDEASTNLSEALLLADRVGDPALRVGPLQGLAALNWARGELEASRRFSLDGLTVAGNIGDDRALGHGYNGLGLVAICRGQSAEARKYLDQSARLFERLGFLGPLAITRINLVELSVCTGNLRKALQLADKTIAQAREVQHPMGIALGLRYRAMILVDLGRLGDAEDNAREAFRLTRQIGDQEDELGAMISLIRIHLARADYAEALKMAKQAIEVAESCDVEGYLPVLWAWTARCQAHLEDVETAMASLEHADPSLGRTWPHQVCRLHLAVSRALAAAGMRSAAETRAEQALRIADASGYRLYALASHSMIAEYTELPANKALHQRVAASLARSLAANLSREDSATFLSQYVKTT